MINGGRGVPPSRLEVEVLLEVFKLNLCPALAGHGLDKFALDIAILFAHLYEFAFRLKHHVFQIMYAAVIGELPASYELFRPHVIANNG